MNVVQDYIKAGQGARTGVRLTQCRGLVIHWIGAPQGKASVIRNNFARDSFGTQYIIDWYDGRIIQTMPENEVAYHVGADRYTATKKAICGSHNPNWYLVGIECCIGDKKIPSDYSAEGKHMALGAPSEVQYRALVEFAAAFLARHGLTVDNLYRHYDITGKVCHVWFVKDKGRWAQFKADVAAKMKGEVEMTEKEIQAMVDAGVKEAVADAVKAAQPTAYTSIAEVPEWARPLVERAMAAKVLAGDGAGKLHLTTDNLVNLQMLDNLGLIKA